MSKAFLMKLVIVIGVFATLSLGSCKKNLETTSTDPTLTSAATDVTLTENLNFVPGQMIVKFKAAKTDKEKDNTLARVSGKILEKIHTKAMKDMGDDEGIVLVSTSLDVLDAVGKIKGAEIEYAEPNYIYKSTSIAYDPLFTNGTLWNMDANNIYGTQASKAWANGHTGSTNVFVGIIDTGIKLDHPDLAGQIWTNPYEIPGNGKDDDGNGYIDDIHGWDFVNNDNTIYDGDNTVKIDDHGTFCAGTIGAKCNDIGVVGMNWNITMISSKFLGPDGSGTVVNAVKAVDYITNLKKLHNMNIVADNNSWCGGGSKALSDAITRANAANILFICAAGNGNAKLIGQNNDRVPVYPASYTIANIISVAAINVNGVLCTWSNYGVKTVHLAAPIGVWSTTADDGYAIGGGTSAAAPHVTGAVALWASTHPGSTAAQIKAAILKSVTATPTLAGKTVSGGRLNVSSF